jgi:hypothetical protein
MRRLLLLLSSIPPSDSFPLASVFGWHLYQMDVQTVFLNGLIEKEEYINQPRDFKEHGHQTRVCRLKKTLYGLTQGPHAWYSKIN